MAKVTGPLLSIDARGKLADSLVFIGWKGIKDVRMWLKPTQPKTGKQGDVRTILGGLGRATKPVVLTKYYCLEAKKVPVGAQSWVSWLVDYMRTYVMPTTAAYEAFITEYEGHAAKDAFDSNAATLLLTDFKVPYATTPKVFKAGAQLYALAKYAVAQRALNPEVFNKSPYTKALATWTAADVGVLKDDIAC